jgi:hypothetical protein
VSVVLALLSMMYRLFYFGICMFGLSCTQPNSQPSVDTLIKKIDSLSAQIQALKLTASDTVYLDSQPQPKQIPVAKQSLDKPKFKKPEALPDKLVDSVVYFYKNSTRVSVIYKPWFNGVRKVLFFKPNGEQTFELEEIRKSFSSNVTIKEWYDNGAVKKIECATYPDASMYWYTSVITFDEQNMPLWKTQSQHPETSVSIPGNNDYYWKNGAWHKQETVIEQPVPH